MQLRGKAIVLFLHDGKFLFTVCYEQEKKETFYIPVGGGIEFGEYSLDAARREVKEEIGQEIEKEKLLEITENIFTFNGVREHEIVFIYLAEFSDKQAYSKSLEGGINAEGKTIQLVWASLADIIRDNIKLYPSGLSTILRKIGVVN